MRVAQGAAVGTYTLVIVNGPQRALTYRGSGWPGSSRGHRRQPDPGQHGDAVPSAVADVQGLVAQVGQLGVREGAVGPLVSCSATASGSRVASQSSSRGSRAPIEFTFQVAIRTRKS